jgi:hypothetical protein
MRRTVKTWFWRWWQTAWRWWPTARTVRRVLSAYRQPDADTYPRNLSERNDLVWDF